MKVALVHYHLEPGGVTRVLENTVQSWKNSGKGPDQWVILSGRPYTGKILDHVRVVEGLDYATLTDSIDPKTLRLRMEDATRDALGQLPDLWHVHNHSLGKNPALTQAIAQLAKEESPMLLQPHDFAEDGRPGNFLNLGKSHERAYPTGGQIHYAALNRRDQSLPADKFITPPSTDGTNLFYSMYSKIIQVQFIYWQTPFPLLLPLT